jgi:hypothetical protein
VPSSGNYIRAVHSLFLHPPWAFGFFVMIDFHDNAKIEGKIIMSSMSTQVTPIVTINFTNLEEDIVHPILLRQFLKKNRAYSCVKIGFYDWPH